ncbi:helix-turn-helix domain-containing protein, partial [Salmonella enterica subsp. enterica serovar Hillingdon]|nr:helix-turn-helix domain-containing protein [Salmonella enterica subsp. enterica serovar Hillingdon]
MQLQKIEMTTMAKCLNLLPMVDKLNTQQDFAARLKAEMSKKGLSVKDLGLACGITYEMARRYTLGTAKPREEKLLKIAEWLGVEPAWLEYGSRSSSVNDAGDSPALTASVHENGTAQNLDDFTNLSDDEKRLLRVFRQYPYIEARNMLLAFEAQFQKIKDLY